MAVMEMQEVLFDITIPVLNEEDSLSENIMVLHDFLEETFKDVDWRITIADNGSIDNTHAIAAALSRENKNISELTVERPGVGLALKTAWIESRAIIIGFMDLDLATDLRHIPEAINGIKENGYDFVYGSRLNPKSKVSDRPLHREVMSRVFNLLLKLILRTKFSDGFCGFKFMRASKWNEIYDRGAKNDGWFFSPETLIAAEFLGLNILELPVEWRHGRDSKVRIIKHTVHSLRGMLNMRKYKYI